MNSKTKLDIFKELKDEYRLSKTPSIIDTTPGKYLMISGAGEPGGAEYSEKAGALYAVAFGIKMTHKQTGRDYAIAKMEGLWWGPGGSSQELLGIPRSEWRWRMMIRTPEFIDSTALAAAAAAAKSKGKTEPVDEVSLEPFHEGTCVQALHIGPYTEETPLIEDMLTLAAKEGYEFDGLHHEIYISDPRRTAPDKLKTLLRHPLKRAENADEQ